MEKHTVSRLSYFFAHLDLLSSETFSFLIFFLLLPFSILLLHLCFSSSVHIVGSLTSKLPLNNIWCVICGCLALSSLRDLSWFISFFCVLPWKNILGWDQVLEYVFKIISMFPYFLMLTSANKNHSNIIYAPVTRWWGNIIFHLQKLKHLEIILSKQLKAPQNNFSVGLGKLFHRVPTV